MYQLYVGNPFTSFSNGDAICVTTNGIVKPDMTAVMGAGVAEFVRDTFKNQKVDKRLGFFIKKYGNMSFYLGEYTFPFLEGFELSEGKRLHLVTLPTKHHYKSNSDPELIKKSAEEVIQRANKFHLSRIFVPLPGGGNGNLKWSQIKPLLAPLDSRFIVFSTNANDFNK